GVEAVPSRALLGGSDMSGIDWPGAYGAVVVTKKGKELAARQPDPIFNVITHMVRAVHSLIDGEPETIGYSETEHGFLFEPSGEDVMVSFFAGDPYEPDEYLITEEQIALEAWAEQVMGMGKRLRDIVKKVDPDLFERDEYSQSLMEFLELSGESFTSFKREKERGLR
ncbi:MAG: hypothetical protein AAFZ18_34485, partial [Myxococcota bacterium]